MVIVLNIQDTSVLTLDDKLIISRDVIFLETIFPYAVKLKFELPPLLPTPIGSSCIPIVSSTVQVSHSHTPHMSQESNVPILSNSSTSTSSSPINLPIDPEVQLPHVPQSDHVVSTHHMVTWLKNGITHHMVTQLKNGITKPKVFVAILEVQDPHSVGEALPDSRWTKAMK